jgi:hypothetical protein
LNFADYSPRHAKREYPIQEQTPPTVVKELWYRA